MQEGFPKPEGELKNKFEDIDEAIDYLKKLADERKIAGKTIVIGLFGNPHSGKTYFTRHFIEKFQTVKEYKKDGPNVYNVTTTTKYNNPHGEVTKQLGLVDYLFVQAEPSLISTATNYGYDFDIQVYIYNPSHEEPRSNLSEFDMVVENSESRIKDL